MTTSIVEAVQQLEELDMTQESGPSAPHPATPPDESSLQDATVGNPISHGQIIDIWRRLKAEGHQNHSLEGLLRGATIYVPPPPPKPEPSEEYKQLMARLRRDEEERSYERMLKASSTRETFAQRFPTAPMSMADSFAEANRPSRQSDWGEDQISHGEVQKQVTLIVNFLVSIAGCAAAIWMVARWWSTTARLFLTLGGSIVVAIAEVAVYQAYSWRMAEGDKKQRDMKEVRQIVKTWVIGDDENKGEGEGQDDDVGQAAEEGKEPVLLQPKDGGNDSTLRKRIAAPT
ncbi:hypothetical protein JX265_007944 [Neoarthrinium moseri]|uniref:Endoplasmic reticulum-based factor for assembly of V-ATPase n=1 Tax=Neoarthrinium moseri TaxID=1658444 RepID=A0A9P9WIQ5_9PEZI|nr:uncharacterized protein JN550_006510 [Neoarthrinium moseri]KAI1865621.1 hypothetical protein JX265_007944 [Neoarthrinium moseri]KAI1868022.1 hypothetical protein JN550_006510 [Neoarthrinium moseri]